MRINPGSEASFKAQGPIIGTFLKGILKMPGINGHNEGSMAYLEHLKAFESFRALRPHKGSMAYFISIPLVCTGFIGNHGELLHPSLSRVTHPMGVFKRGESDRGVKIKPTLPTHSLLPS